MKLPFGHFTRRQFLTASGVGAAVALGGSEIALAEPTAVEKANEKLVRDMCKSVANVNPDEVAPFLADKFIFQITDGAPELKGKEAFLNFIGRFMAPYERAEFIVYRSHVIGNIVINERTDNFYAKEGGTDQSFPVSGMCVVKDGKVLEWRDYKLPE